MGSGELICQHISDYSNKIYLGFTAQTSGCNWITRPDSGTHFELDKFSTQACLGPLVPMIGYKSKIDFRRETNDSGNSRETFCGAGSVGNDVVTPSSMTVLKSRWLRPLTESVFELLDTILSHILTEKLLKNRLKKYYNVCLQNV